QPIIMYDSHGRNQTSTPSNYILSALNVTLANGAMFNSWESYNAFTFQSTTSVWQGQIAQWLQKGGTVGVGNVYEPSASSNSVANEDQIVAMLLAGKTWAEAAWSGLRQLSFVNTVVGDPLMTWKMMPAPGTSSVVQRQLFYNRSIWDNYDPGANS